MMTTILWAILFFGLLGIIKLFFNSKEREFHEQEMKKMRENKEKFLKERNMTEEEFENLMKPGVD